MSIYARQTGISIQLVWQRSAKGLSHPHPEELPQQDGGRYHLPAVYNSILSRMAPSGVSDPRVFIGVQKKNWMNASHKVS